MRAMVKNVTRRVRSPRYGALAPSGMVGRKLMQTGYFYVAWHDIKNSPGWFGKLLVLSLAGLIPVFGWIVVAGYLYGWARDIAWGAHAPLPSHVLGNEDGMLYRRGLFVVVIALVSSLIPFLFEALGSVVTGGLFSGGMHGLGRGFAFPLGILSGVAGFTFFVLSVAACFFALFFHLVGSMRASIYGRLSAGFQIEKIWNMVRYDFGGILRIGGMAVLLSLVAAALCTLLLFIVLLVMMVAVIALAGGNLNVSAHYPDPSLVGIIFSVGAAWIVFALIAAFASMVMTTFIATMIVRALGYWTRQFNVPAWRGQDDPMPFETTRVPGGLGGHYPPRGF